MDSRDSLSHEGSRPMLSLGSSSQILSSLSLVSTVINPGQKQTLPKSTYNCRNLSSSSGSSNKDKDPQDSSSGVSLDPFTMAPAPMTSEYSPTHTPCHNCRTLGQSDCNTMHGRGDTACSRCSLLALECDFDSDFDAGVKDELKVKRLFCRKTAVCGTQCTGSPDTFIECVYYDEGESPRDEDEDAEEEKKVLHVVNAGTDEEDEVSSVVVSEGDAEADSSTKSITARCEGCGKGIDADEEDVNCERCRDVLVRIARGFPGFVPSSHLVHGMFIVRFF